MVLVYEGQPSSFIATINENVFSDSIGTVTGTLKYNNSSPLKRFV
jgi:hypothetical protein